MALALILGCELSAIELVNHFLRYMAVKDENIQLASLTLTSFQNLNFWSTYEMLHNSIIVLQYISI